MDIAKQIATGSNHPIATGGCVIIRDREIIGDGRSVLADCKVEIDCVTYAIATACKRGTPVFGATIYTTRYPFSASVFQLHLMGCLLYTSPSPRDRTRSRMPSSA